MRIEKTSESYIITDKLKEKKVEIYLEVDLSSTERTVTITGVNNDFRFKKSNPYLVEKIAEMIDKAVNISHNVQRFKEDK